MGKQMARAANNGRTLALLEQVQRLDDEKRRVTDYCKQLERFKSFVYNMGWPTQEVRDAAAACKGEERDVYLRDLGCVTEKWVDKFIDATTTKEEEKEPTNG